MRHAARLIATMGLLLFAGCADTRMIDSQSQTHWLRSCEADAECGSELACECGVCAATCSANEACSVAGRTTECRSPDHEAVAAQCGAAASVSLCLEPCGAGCGEGERCVAGSCIAAARGGDAGSAIPPGKDGGDEVSDGSAVDGSAGEGGRDAGAPPADAGGAVADASMPDSGTSELDCSGTSVRFPAFDRTCETAADCAIGTRPLNCCGTMRVTGIRALDSDVFAAAADVCSGELKNCECLAGPTIADDGTTADPRATLDSSASVDCVAGLCQTTIGPCGGRCDPDTEICVTQQSFTNVEECKPLPPACTADRTCGCVAESVCAPGFGVCSEQGKNHVACTCINC